MTTYPTPPQNWMEQPKSSGSGRVLLFVLGGCALLFLGCTGGFIVGWISGAASSIGLTDFADAMPVQATVRVDAPDAVSVDETFEIGFTVTSTAASMTQNILTVDLSGAICDQFEIVDVQPAPAGRVIEYGWHEYTYNAPIDPGGQQTFVFTVRPKAPGRIDGDIEAYFDGFNVLTQPVVITVNAAE